MPQKIQKPPAGSKYPVKALGIQSKNNPFHGSFSKDRVDNNYQ
jgi:hypothetical protein